MKQTAWQVVCPYPYKHGRGSGRSDSAVIVVGYDGHHVPLDVDRFSSDSGRRRPLADGYHPLCSSRDKIVAAFRMQEGWPLLKRNKVGAALFGVTYRESVAIHEEDTAK